MIGSLLLSTCQVAVPVIRVDADIRVAMVIGEITEEDKGSLVCIGILPMQLAKRDFSDLGITSIILNG